MNLGRSLCMIAAVAAASVIATDDLTVLALRYHGNR